jgi:hypothetical protein
MAERGEPESWQAEIEELCSDKSYKPFGPLLDFIKTLSKPLEAKDEKKQDLAKGLLAVVKELQGQRKKGIDISTQIKKIAGGYVQPDWTVLGDVQQANRDFVINQINLVLQQYGGKIGTPKWKRFLEKWGMAIFIFGLVIASAIGVALYYLYGEVAVTIASDRDKYGRCIDRELFVINKSNTDALDLVISFEVDYFTRQRSVQVEYGDEHEELISSARKTLLPKKQFIPVEHSLDYDNSKLTIPQLKPSEYLHIYYGGETVLDSEKAILRMNLLEDKNSDLMNKPRVSSVVRKDGKVAIRRIKDCKN